MRWGPLLLLVACGEPTPAPAPPRAPSASAMATATATPSVHASASAEPPVDKKRVGPPHLAKRITRLLRGEERDALVVVFDDDAPGPSGILILDADTERIAFRTGWDAAIVSDTHVLYGVERRALVASRLGVSLAGDVKYLRDDEEKFLQPVLFDLASGRERMLTLAGGALLTRDGDRVVGTLTPAAKRSFALDLEKPSWQPTAGELKPPVPIEAEVGWKVETRDGRLSVERIDADNLQAFKR